MKVNGEFNFDENNNKNKNNKNLNNDNLSVYSDNQQNG